MPAGHQGMVMISFLLPAGRAGVFLGYLLWYLVYPACHCGGQPCDIQVIVLTVKLWRGRNLSFVLGQKERTNPQTIRVASSGVSFIYVSLRQQNGGSQRAESVIKWQLLKHCAVERHLCTGRRERSAQGCTVPSGVLFVIRCDSFLLLSKKEMHLQSPLFCLPAFVQVKWNVEITCVILYHCFCQYFGNIPVSIRNYGVTAAHAARGCLEKQLHMSFCWISAAPAVKHKASQAASESSWNFLCLPCLDSQCQPLTLQIISPLCTLFLPVGWVYPMSSALHNAATLLSPRKFPSFPFSPLVFTGTVPLLWPLRCSNLLGYLIQHRC